MPRLDRESVRLGSVCLTLYIHFVQAGEVDATVEAECKSLEDENNGYVFMFPEQFRDAEVNRLAAAIERAGYGALRMLGCDKVRVSSDRTSWQRLIGALSRCTDLEYLQMAGDFSDPTLFSSLTESICKCDSLAQLEFPDSQLHRGQVSSIGQLVATKKGARIQSLSLQGNTALGDDDGEGLCELAKVYRACPSIQMLDLSGIRISERAAKSLAAEFSGVVATGSAEAVSGGFAAASKSSAALQSTACLPASSAVDEPQSPAYRPLSNLTLNRTCLGADGGRGLRALAPLFQSCKGLLSLYLMDCQIGSTGDGMPPGDPTAGTRAEDHMLFPIAHALRQPWCQLNNLQLGNNDLHDSDAAVLSMGLRHNTSLTYLSLDKARFSYRGLAMVADSLLQHPSLGAFCTRFSHFESNGKDMKAQQAAGTALGRMVVGSFTITTFDLGGSTLSNACVSAFSAEIKHGGILERLYVGDIQAAPGEPMAAVELVEAVTRPRPLASTLGTLTMGNVSVEGQVGCDPRLSGALYNLLASNSMLQSVLVDLELSPDPESDHDFARQEDVRSAVPKVRHLQATASLTVNYHQVFDGDHNTNIAQAAWQWMDLPVSGGVVPHRVDRACRMLQCLHQGPLSNSDIEPIAEYASACLVQCADSITRHANEAHRVKVGHADTAKPGDPASTSGALAPWLHVRGESWKLLETINRSLAKTSYRGAAGPWSEGWSASARKRLWLCMQRAAGPQRMGAAMNLLCTGRDHRGGNSREVLHSRAQDDSAATPGAHLPESDAISGLEGSTRLQETWKQVCTTAIHLRTVHLAEWRHCHGSHQDAQLVFISAKDGRPLELAKRLLRGARAGGLAIQGDVESCVDGVVQRRRVGPLEAARLGGHLECVSLLQEAMG